MTEERGFIILRAEDDMKLSFHSTALFVADIGRSLDFYCGVLGQAVRTDMGTNVILEHGITLWQIDPSHLIPRTLGGKALAEGNRFELYFETDDIDTASAVMKENSARFMHDVHEEPWGQRTVRVFDPDGHLIEIGESMMTFLGRMKHEGMTVEEIASKTGMKADDVMKNLR